ncbi:NAD(P)H-flavin reductase [Echinimonas agarilytica]|uniref:NAD(P)H-flavin reductase n=1 Tax=Echinimonas agarilytica TaxID=1215918 RepID=A0AA42B654_9GAMM|nr:NAD(P)H-flavin reductase [Echinimonas agarilytica]MCM2678249.1 NAD(P)H-flavin reductase [Echinimonas agarilytica]
MNKVQCTVRRIEALTPFVHRVILAPVQQIDYLPGQYLMLHLSDDDQRPFSIASPQGAKEIELHIGVGREDSYAGQAMAHLKATQEVTISLPGGDAYWHPERHESTILMAGGTGFSYVHSILLSMINVPRKLPIHVYWGVRKEADLYDFPRLKHLADTHDWLNVHAVVEEPSAGWTGMKGKVHEAVLTDFEDMSGHDLYMAGRFEMVGIARDAFLTRGMPRERMFSDAFAFID